MKRGKSKKRRTSVAGYLIKQIKTTQLFFFLIQKPNLAGSFQHRRPHTEINDIDRVRPAIIGLYQSLIILPQLTFMSRDPGRQGRL